MIAPTVISAVQGAERRLVDALALRSRALQPRHAQAHGLWKDAPVIITTRVYEGDAVSYMRVATIAGTGLAIGSLFVLARPNRGLPILAAELLWRGATQETTVSTTVVPTRDAAGGGRMPPVVLELRATPEQLPEAFVALDRVLDEWISTSGATIPFGNTADLVRSRQHEYLAMRRGDPQTRSLLAAMFGSAWAGEYVGTVLFPAV